MAQRGGRRRRPRVVRRRARETAFILAGGAARGAYQAGSLLYLEELGIQPDLIVASSIGVINACLYLTGGATHVAEAWTDFRRPWDVFGLDWRRNALLGNSLFVPDRAAAAIEAKIDFNAVLEADVDLHFVTTNFSRGREEFLGNRNLESPDDLRTVSRIGWTIPLLYPPVKYGRDYYVDGGFAWNVPLEFAVEQGAKRIFVLSCISRQLEYRADFPHLTDVAERFYDFLWRTAGNSSLLYKRLEQGQFDGVEIHVLEAERVTELRPWQLLHISPAKSRRYLQEGYRDARRTLARYPAGHENTGTAGR